MILRYDIMEFNTAVKPFMFRWVFDNTDLDTVMYIDPDICLYSRFEDLEALLAQKDTSAVLTPHITSPLEDGKVPNDHHMLQSGVFNLGFMAANRRQETLDYIDWWGRRLTTQCMSDVPNSLFTDQKWCDLAPCFIDGLKVFKHPGYNVAYWNMAHRAVKHSESEGWTVNDQPLAFFHFSGVNVNKSQMVSKHQTRFEWDDIVPLQPLFTDYLNRLRRNGASEAGSMPYAYSDVSETMQMSPIVRALYREENEEPISIDENELEHYLIDLCNQRAESPQTDDDIYLSRVMMMIYSLRPDLQQVFNLGSSDGQRQFINWFESAAQREYSLPEAMIFQNQMPRELKKN
jgi:hypothetical protein